MKVPLQVEGSPNRCATARGSLLASVPVLEAGGWVGRQPELNALCKVGKFGEMRALISDDMVARLGVVETPEQCAAEIGHRFGAHASHVCCYFAGYEPGDAQIADLIGALHAIPGPA